MGHSRSGEMPAPVAALSRRIEKWRTKRAHRATPMPISLWTEAAVLSQQFGVHRISRYLGLGYNKLKQQALQREVADSRSRPFSRASFVELSGLEIDERKDELLSSWSWLTRTDRSCVCAAMVLRSWTLPAWSTRSAGLVDDPGDGADASAGGNRAC